MTITLSEKLKTAGAELPAPGVALPRQLEGREEVVSFRQLGGDFGQTVQSLPGTITVVQENGKEVFRDAVLGGRMDIRSGAQELHASEIYFVQNNESLLKAATVTEALKSSGVPQNQLSVLLNELGLKAAAQMAPRDLGVSALKRLSIGCSLYARARILLYDRPFLGSDPAWVERIAQLLLSHGEGNVRSIIITGETKLPQAWTSNPRVSVQDPQQPQTTSGIIARTPAGQLPARPSVLSGTLIAGEIVTRPQPIYQQAVMRQSETLKSEAIENPNTEFHSDLQKLGGGAGLSQLQREAEQTARKDGVAAGTAEDSRRNEGDLTRVTGFDRFRVHPSYRKVSDTLRKVRGRISARPMAVAIPPAKRLLALKKKEDFQFMIACFFLALIAMSLVLYFKS